MTNKYINRSIINIILKYRGYEFENKMNEDEILTLIDIYGHNAFKIKIKSDQSYDDVCHYYYYHKYEPLLLYCCKYGFNKSINIILNTMKIKTFKFELNYASTNCNIDTISNLIKHGAKINSYCDGDYETPLHSIISMEYKEVITLLLKHGADINLIDMDGITPFVRIMDVMCNNVNNIDIVNKLKKIAMEMLNYPFNPDTYGRNANTQFLEVLIHECMHDQIGNDISTKILLLYPNTNLDVKNKDGEFIRNYINH